MRELQPYKTLNDLKQAIDNGGRFYNLFTSANDDVVTSAELAKAAGVFSAGDYAFLFLEMAQQDLADVDRPAVLELLDAGLRKNFLSKQPSTLLPSSVESDGKVGDAVIVSGYPQFVENKTEFGGFIMIPIVAGKVTTFTMIPIYDKFDVYEVFDDPELTSLNSVIATVRGKRLEHDGAIRFGGILRELKFNDTTNNSHKFYLEVAYYTPL